jgi:hypothetical protein
MVMPQPPRKARGLPQTLLERGPYQAGLSDYTTNQAGGRHVESGVENGGLPRGYQCAAVMGHFIGVALFNNYISTT